jgi:aerobic-type carbon monoxide dehydrogenase small subunit (CoxS/CutS family)
MPESAIPIQWPDGRRGQARAGEPWLEVARRCRQTIPTACCTGSCGACEIEVNGVVVRACISTVPAVGTRGLDVRRVDDPHW